MGVRAYRNTQPFTREFAGRIHTFAHNGSVPGIFAMRRSRHGQFGPVGETDSERAFCLLLERLHGAWRSKKLPSLDKRMDVVTRFAAELRTFGSANFLYSDGDALFAHGDRRQRCSGSESVPPGLVVNERRCPAPDDGRIILVASVPLTDGAWSSLAEGEVIALSGGRTLLRSR
jgi:predicted glutamine amidotransferase